MPTANDNPNNPTTNPNDPNAPTVAYCVMYEILTRVTQDDGYRNVSQQTRNQVQSVLQSFHLTQISPQARHEAQNWLQQNNIHKAA